MQPLIDGGATGAHSPREAAAGADVVVTRHSKGCVTKPRWRSSAQRDSAQAVHELRKSRSPMG